MLCAWLFLWILWGQLQGIRGPSFQQDNVSLLMSLSHTQTNSQTVLSFCIHVYFIVLFISSQNIKSIEEFQIIIIVIGSLKPYICLNLKMYNCVQISII